MCTWIERSGKSTTAGFVDLCVGDSILCPWLVDWEFVMEVPRVVAEFWVTNQHDDSTISLDGRTPESCPVKDWSRGVCVVVGTPLTDPKNERVCVLQKNGDGSFHLYRSRETRGVEDS